MNIARPAAPLATAPLDALSGPLADALIVTALAMAGVMATAVVLTRGTVRQAIVLSGYGMVLGLLFLILQAPDVAMSQFGVGTVVLPLLVALALHATRHHRAATTEAGHAGGGDEGEQNAGPAAEDGRDGGGEARR